MAVDAQGGAAATAANIRPVPRAFQRGYQHSAGTLIQSRGSGQCRQHKVTRIS